MRDSLLEHPVDTVLLKSGLLQHDIHYWLGKDAKEVDSAIVSDKAVELDAALGSHAVQYREVQGYETESMQERAKALEVVQYVKDNKHGGRCEVAAIEDGKFVGDSDVGEFWSLFGGYAPITRDSPCAVQDEPVVPYVKLFWMNKGKACLIEETSLKKEMLSTERCYMLDCDIDIFVWMGRNTSITERKTSMSAIEDILSSQGRSKSSYITILTEGSETTTFKSYFASWSQSTPSNLYEEGRGKVAAIFKHQGYNVKELPEEDFQPFIDSSGILKVWRVDCHDVSLIPAAEQSKLFSGDCFVVQYVYPGDGRDEYLYYAWLGCGSTKEDRADAISLICTMVESAKGHPVLAQVFEGKEPLQFFSIFQTLIVFKGGMSSCYKNFISENGILDETYDEDKIALFRVQGSGPENMQAIQVDLVAVSWFVFKAPKDRSKTWAPKVLLDMASGSLNSSYCYILKAGASIFTWAGNLSSPRDHNLLDRMLDQIYPGRQTISVREGSEPDVFWDAIGGKAEYPREKGSKKHEEDPHLFTCAFTEVSLPSSSYSLLQAKEIFNFTQDDLTTEEVIVLDCHNEIYVWVGQHASIKSKEQALALGKKYIEANILLEGLSLETTIYVVAEGHEPSFFTRFFQWDPSKSHMHGNSFERKLAVLKGSAPKSQTPSPSSRIIHGARYSEATPNGSRSRSSSSGAFHLQTGSPASHAFYHATGAPSSCRLSSPIPVARKLFPGSSDCSDANVSSMDLDQKSSQSPRDESQGSSFTGPEELSSCLGTFRKMAVSGDGGSRIDSEVKTFSYERLRVTSDDPVTGIDVTKREAYLSDIEFQEIFGMTKKAFYQLPKWRRDKLKMAVALAGQRQSGQYHTVGPKGGYLDAPGNWRGSSSCPQIQDCYNHCLERTITNGIREKTSRAETSGAARLGRITNKPDSHGQKL
ncbi:actin filament capping [Asimina triloba]